MIGRSPPFRFIIQFSPAQSSHPQPRNLDSNLIQPGTVTPQPVLRNMLHFPVQPNLLWFGTVPPELTGLVSAAYTTPLGDWQHNYSVVVQLPAQSEQIIEPPALSSTWKLEVNTRRQTNDNSCYHDATDALNSL